MTESPQARAGNFRSPRRIWRRRLVTLWIAGASALAVCAAWAFVYRSALPPLPDASLDPVDIAQPNEEHDSMPALDENAFLVRLWNPPPPPPPEEEPQQRQPIVAERTVPLNLQLIGIVEEDGKGRRRAALYDPQTDTLHIVAEGQTLQQHEITAITAKYVEFQHGRTTKRLELITASADGLDQLSIEQPRRNGGRGRGSS